MTYNPSSIWDLFHSWACIFYYTEPYWLLCFSWATVLSSFSSVSSFKTSTQMSPSQWSWGEGSFMGILGVKCWLKWAEKKVVKKNLIKGRLSLEELGLGRNRKIVFRCFAMVGLEENLFWCLLKSKTYHHRCQEYHSRWELSGSTLNTEKKKK